MLAAVKFAMQDARRRLLPLERVLHHEPQMVFACTGGCPLFFHTTGLANLKVNYVKHEKKLAMNFAR